MKLNDLLEVPVSKKWDGKSAVLDMQLEDGPYKQMEWIGFYFEHIAQKHFDAEVAGAKEPYDFKIGRHLIDAKTHVINDGKTDIILNDKQRIDDIVQKQPIYYLVLMTEVEYDTDGSFHEWHEQVKGGKSEYSKKRESEGRPSRRRKSISNNKSLQVFRVDKQNVDKLKVFNQGRNFDGSPRNQKYILDTSQIGPILIKEL